MTPFNIPEEHLKIIEDYSSLSDEQKAKIIAKIGDLSLGTTHATASEYVSGETGIPKTTIKGILGVFFNLLTAKNSIKDRELFVESLKAGIKKAGVERDGHYDKSIDSLVDDLMSLVNSENNNLSQTNKVIETLTYNQKNFISSDIKMDLRSVFDAENSNECIGFINIFNLRIKIKEGDDYKDIYVALDGRDISSLKETLSIAERQAAVIAKKLGFESIEVK